ncbi:hypothetical protein [Mycoplasmopsis columboralis]|uniref:Uncharacterized protein n=1 Tax=Mycoplasmopsis columboralis TaxID=171282 RepID=A0A449B5W1_9BACT|nr:hypothetical protein [Mycoplasmopsis columboralis]VEU75962.1 Uncharacterised protein [Mycoplasmopsis columboralis]
MSKLINKLAEIFNISTEEVKAKLSLSDNYKRQDLLNALDVYAVYESKEDLTNYISDKTKNTTAEINKLKTQLEETKQQAQEKENLAQDFKNKITQHLSGVIKEFNFLDKITVEDLDYHNYDFTDLKNSILKQARANNWRVKTTEVNKEETAPEYTGGRAEIVGNAVVIKH